MNTDEKIKEITVKVDNFPEGISELSQYLPSDHNIV
jgi:hypothetical protein